MVNQKGNTLIIIGIVGALIIVGVSGYVVGKYKPYQGSSIKNNGGISTQSPTSSEQPLPTNPNEIASSTKLLEPELVSTTNWRVVSFPQNVVVSQGGETRPAKVELKIPSNWTAKTVKSGTGGADCKDFQITSDDGDVLLIIKSGCSDTDNDYIPISGQVQKVELTTNKGNDGHDSYTVRYYDSSKNDYHFGEISVPPGATIDIQKDEIYPNLILQYEPDRAERWLWTSYDLTYKGAVSNQRSALSNVDTIISTLKLTD